MPRRVCRFNWAIRERGSIAKTLRKLQDCFTTKGTKETYKPEDNTLDPALKLGRAVASPVYCTAEVIMNYPAASGRGIKKHCEQNAPRGRESNPERLKLIRSPGLGAASILRVLRALRGEFSLASVLNEPKVRVTNLSKRQGMLQKLVIIAACVILFSVPGLAQASNVIASADASFDRWNGTFAFSDYQGKLQEALALYEEALPTIASDALQTRSYVLNRLAQGYFELGMAYLTDRDEQERAYGKGKDYALDSLRLDPMFVESEKESFRAALGSASDVKAVFWYANNLGRYINFHLLTAMSGGMKDVQASFERAIELDPTYLGGAPWRSLGSFLARVPTFMGGNQDEAQTAFANAATIDPTFIENYVDDAEYIAKPAKDWNRFCNQISIALAAGANQEAMATWPLYNALALQRAQDLVADHACGD